METKLSPRKSLAAEVKNRLEGLPAGFGVVGVIGNPYAFTVIDPEGRTFRVSIKESK